MYGNYSAGIVLCWCLMLEGYGPTIKYIKGNKNDTEYYLIRLPIIDYDVTEISITRETLS